MGAYSSSEHHSRKTPVTYYVTLHFQENRVDASYFLHHHDDVLRFDKAIAGVRL